MKQALILLPLLLNTISNRTYPINEQYAWDSEDYVDYHYLRKTGDTYFSYEDITMYHDDQQMSWNGKAFSYVIDDGVTIDYDSMEIRIFYWYSSWDLYLTQIETYYSPNFTGTYRKESAFFKDGFYSYINLTDFDLTTLVNILTSWTSNQKYMYTSAILNTDQYSNTQQYSYQEPTNEMNEYTYYVEVYSMTTSQPSTNTHPELSTLMNVRSQVYYGYEYETVQDPIEVIDLSSLLFDILMMPWAFLSVAFNFTLWPGTPYAINLSHIATVFLGTLVLIFLIKLLLKYIR